MKKIVKSSKRSAFTLIELIMVIVILGIVSMIATDIIANMYTGYIRTKIVNDLEQKTETVISQIAQRLQYRVKETMISKDSTTGNYLTIASADINQTFDMVEWIGYDNESFLGENNGTFSVPGWSGFIDVDSNDTNNTDRTLKSPGSHLDVAERTINALSNATVSLDSTIAVDRPAVIFKCPKTDNNMSTYGWDGINALAGHVNTLAVESFSNDTFEYDATQGDANKSVCEQYYLAWTAYAIAPQGGTADDFNLTLKYNYQPWYGESYNDGNSSVLAEHVSTFRVMQVGETLRVKVCIQDGNITGEPVGFCKEKAIF